MKNNQIEIFKSKIFGNIRTIMIDGEPWFVGKDVARALGYSNSRDAIAKHVDPEDKGVSKCDTLGGAQELAIINESGLYALIYGSKLKSAKDFKRWVTSEVLPSIRKHGTYMLPEVLQKAIDIENFEDDIKVPILYALYLDDESRSVIVKSLSNALQREYGKSSSQEVI